MPDDAERCSRLVRRAHAADVRSPSARATEPISPGSSPSRPDSISRIERSQRAGPRSRSTGPPTTGTSPTDILDFNKINTYRLSQLNYFLKKMRDTDRRLTRPFWTRPRSSGDRRWGIPTCTTTVGMLLLLMGRANGALEGGLHLRAAEGTPMANVFVGLMQEDRTRRDDDVRRQHGSVSPWNSRARAASLGGGGIA